MGDNSWSPDALGRAANHVVRDLLSRMGRVSRGGTDPDADYVVHDEQGNELARVEVKAVASVRPSDSFRFSRWAADDRTVVVVAPRISVEARRVLEDAGLSWATLEGATTIRSPRMLVSIQEMPARPASVPSPEAALSWSGVVRDVAEFVLTLAHGATDGTVPLPRVEDVATVVGHSRSATGKALQALAGAGWIHKPGAARGRGSLWQLSDPTGLLDAWAQTLPAPAEILAHGLIGDVQEFVRGPLTDTLPEGGWCLAETSASELLAPYLTTTPVLECAVSGAVARHLEDHLTALDLRPVERGHRLRFVVVPDVTLRTSSRVDDVPVTSPARTYGDLLRTPGRGPELAAHVRETVLGY